MGLRKAGTTSRIAFLSNVTSPVHLFIPCACNMALRQAAAKYERENKVKAVICRFALSMKNACIDDLQRLPLASLHALTSPSSRRYLQIYEQTFATYHFLRHKPRPQSAMSSTG